MKKTNSDIKKVFDTLVKIITDQGIFVNIQYNSSSCIYGLSKNKNSKSLFFITLNYLHDIESKLFVLAHGYGHYLHILDLNINKNYLKWTEMREGRIIEIEEIAWKKGEQILKNLNLLYPEIKIDYNKYEEMSKKSFEGYRKK